MNREFLENLAKNHDASLRVIAKDMQNIARLTVKTPFEEEEKFQSNLVQGAFYLTAYSIATKAFNKMIDEKQKDPDCQRGQVEYFLEVILEMQKENMDREKAIREAKEKGESNDNENQN